MINGSISTSSLRDAPIALLADNEDSKSSISSLKRKSSEPQNNGKKKRKTVDIVSCTRPSIKPLYAHKLVGDV